jgi:hypothetical protein
MVPGNTNFLVNGKQDTCTYFVRHHSNSPYRYSEADIKDMLRFLVDNNLYVVFGHKVFQQSVGIPMDTNCAPLLPDLFLHSYEAEFVQKLLQDNNKKLAVSFNHTSKYIDDVLSINNHNFHNYVLFRFDQPNINYFQFNTHDEEVTTLARFIFGFGLM